MSKDEIRDFLKNHGYEWYHVNGDWWKWILHPDTNIHGEIAHNEDTILMALLQHYVMNHANLYPLYNPNNAHRIMADLYNEVFLDDTLIAMRYYKELEGIAG